jgi:RNA polymerase sigma factor (sigma-70 family)
LGIRQRREEKKAALSASSALPEEITAEDPLEALLDEESDEEFGDLVLKDKKSAGKPVKLAEWTAQDFSSIYVRFRPHLERHARRFLRNPSQVDEVVQDAFLYLMVSLPELDSEIGVLRFLKWKTRLLALDVIRASGRAYVNSIDDVQEPESLDPEISVHLEQQDDAAVVKLALSKLNPRHREVLIASMYEEKSTEQIASQVGLSENATRQLIFRARAAFKKALIGDVDTTGMSAAAILSVAARKAAQEGKKIGASAMALIALVVMSLSVWPGLTGNRSNDQMAGPAQSGSPLAPTPSQSESPAATDPTPSLEPSPEPSGSPEGNDAGNKTEPAPSSSPASGQTEQESTLSARPSAGEQALDEFTKISGATGSFTLAGESFEAKTDNGIVVRFQFRPGQLVQFSKINFELDLADSNFFATPQDGAETSFVGADGQFRFMYLATIPFLYDENGKSWTSSTLSNATVRIEVKLNKAGSEVELISISTFKNG